MDELKFLNKKNKQNLFMDEKMQSNSVKTNSTGP